MDFSRHPFGVPPSVENSNKINGVVRKSWEMQKILRVSNACLIVNVVLHRCLKAINVQSNIVYGIIKLEDLNIPHVWLDILGHIVDNTLVHDTCISEPMFITMKGSAEYAVTSVKDKEDLYLGDHVTKRVGLPDHDVAPFEWMLSNQDKGLALCKNVLQLRKYFETMTDFMLDKYKVEIQTISETVVTNCWNCNRSDIALKQCSRCKIAKYCSRECQKRDRKCHKLPCVQPNT